MLVYVLPKIQKSVWCYYFNYRIFTVFILRYSLQLTESELVLSFGAGVCSPEDTEKCLVFLYLLEDAVFPLPIVHPNGTIEWPDGNMPITLILYGP